MFVVYVCNYLSKKCSDLLATAKLACQRLFCIILLPSLRDSKDHDIVLSGFCHAKFTTSSAITIISWLISLGSWLANPPPTRLPFFFFCWSPECLIGCYWPSPSHGFWGTISIFSLYVYFINFIILIKISYTLSIAILCQTMFFFLYCLFANKLRSFCTATGNRIWRSLYGSFEAYYLLYLLTLTSYRLWWTDPYRTNIAACHNFQW